MNKIEIDYLRKLLRKALLYRLMTNIEKIVTRTGLPHSQISKRMGRATNWFNDAYNNNEDIQLSSLSGILAVVDTINKIDEYKISDIFDEKVLKITTLMIKIADEESEHIPAFINSEKTLFMDLIGDWGSLGAKRKLTSLEQKYLKRIQSIVSKGEND